MKWQSYPTGNSDRPLAFGKVQILSNFWRMKQKVPHVEEAGMKAMGQEVLEQQGNMDQVKQIILPISQP